LTVFELLQICGIVSTIVEQPAKARKLNAVPVFSITESSEPESAELLISGIEVSMLATTTRPTIIVTAAITTVRIRLTMSI
jgi:Na+/H+-translocating membrane pyrophosphatase